MRIEKKTRIKGLPGRVLLNVINSLTGSYPTISRISSDNRTGVYSGSFNDTNVIIFNSSSNLLIGQNVSTNFMSKSLFDEFAKEIKLSGSNIVSSGSKRKGVGDVFLSFVNQNRGQDLQPFNDNTKPEVDGKSTNNPFYATGSTIEEAGSEWFQQPLWSKSRIVIDLTPSTNHTIAVSNFGLGNNFSNYPMAYWNKDRRMYEGLGSGKQFGGYQTFISTGSFSGSTSTTTNLHDFLQEQFLGFTPSILHNKNILSGGLLFSGSAASITTTFGFPYADKFSGTGSNLINVSDYIDRPFLVEKIVLEFSGGMRLRNALAVSSNLTPYAAIATFFLLNQRRPMNYIVTRNTAYQSSSLNVATGVTTYSGSNVSASFTIPFLGPASPSARPGVLIDSTRDVISYLQITSLTPSGALHRDVLTREFVIETNRSSSLDFQGRMIISGSAKNFIKAEHKDLGTLAIAKIDLGPSGAVQTFNFEYDAHDGGRNSAIQPCGRDKRNTLEAGTVSALTSSFVLNNITIQPYERYSKNNGYILLPGDQLIFGVQVPYDSFFNHCLANDNTIQASYGLNGPALDFNASYSKLILYGSEIKEDKEQHDTLNQLLTSNNVYEVLE